MSRLTASIKIIAAVTLIHASRAEAAPAIQPTPGDIIQKMYNASSNVTSYSDSGTVRTLVTVGGQSRVQMTWFSIAFKKPGFLRIDWTAPANGRKDTYVLWREKKDTFLYSERLKQYRKDPSLANTLNSLMVQSGGAVRHVPCMLMKIMNKQEFSDLSGLKFESTDRINDGDCYKVSGARKESRVTLWIDKKDYLLRKMETSSALGSVLEIHDNIKINGNIENNALFFTPPPDSRKVDKF